MSKRKFVPVSDVDVDSFRKKTFAKATNHATASSLNSLITFHNTHAGTSQNSNYSELNSSEMNTLLEKFYICSRTSDNQHYKASSLRTMRSNLSRAVKESHDFDIFTDKAFSSSNIVFENVLKNLKTIGKGVIDHHKDISQSDLQLVIQNLSPENAKELQLLVWFYIQLHFCKRGIENADKVKKNHYAVKTIDDKKCIVQVVDELTKNHRHNDTTRTNGGLIAEHGQFKCPVRLFEKYLSKLSPSCDFLWQLPRNTVCDYKSWYDKKCGVNTIAKFMKQISGICGLSQQYTNHCIRSTTCTLLGKAYSDIDIQAISGHKSLSGLSHYKRIEDSSKMNMSESLSKYYLPPSQSVDPPIPSPLCVDADCVHDKCCLSYGIGNQPSDQEILNELVDFDMNSLSVPNEITLQPTIHSDLQNIDVNNLIFKNAEKNENPSTNVYQLFQNCNNCTISNISINFAK